MHRGFAKAFSKNPSGAEKDATKAIELDPKNGGAFFLRANARKARNRHKESIADFTEGIKLAPGDYSIQLNSYTGRAGAKNAVGDYIGAIADYDTAAKLDSKKALTFFLRGVVKYQMDEKNEALKDLSKAGELGYSEAYDVIKEIREHKP